MGEMGKKGPSSCKAARERTQGAIAGANLQPVALIVRRYMNGFESRQLHASARTIGRQLAYMYAALHAGRRQLHVSPCTCVLHRILMYLTATDVAPTMA